MLSFLFKKNEDICALLPPLCPTVGNLNTLYSSRQLKKRLTSSWGGTAKTYPYGRLPLFIVKLSQTDRLWDHQQPYCKGTWLAARNWPSTSSLSFPWQCPGHVVGSHWLNNWGSSKVRLLPVTEVCLKQELYLQLLPAYSQSEFRFTVNTLIPRSPPAP